MRILFCSRTHLSRELGASKVLIELRRSHDGGFALVRMNPQRSKRRMYCVIEHTLLRNPVWRRRLAYRADMDWTTLGRLEMSPREWFDGWEQIGIDMHTIPSGVYNWQDYEVLRYFGRYGTKRFWLDDIWDFDWEKCRAYARSINVVGIPDGRITPPPKPINALLTLFDKSLMSLKAFRSSFN